MSKERIESVTQVIDILGGVKTISKGLGVTTAAITQMKLRGEISSKYLTAFLRELNARGYLEIDLSLFGQVPYYGRL